MSEIVNWWGVEDTPCLPFVCANGLFMKKEQFAIPPHDWTSMYGGKGFCGMRVVNGNVIALDRHLDRLFYTADRLKFKIRFSKAEIREFLLETIVRNETRDSYIRLDGVVPIPGIGIYNPTQEANMLICIRLYDLPHYLGPTAEKEGIVAYLADDFRNIDQWKGPSVKMSGDGYVRARLHKQAANALGYDEVLFRYRAKDGTEYIVDGGGEELIIEQFNNPWWNIVPNEMGILGGITREIVKTIAEQALGKIIDCRPTPVSTCTSGLVTGMCVMGTAVRVVPVKAVYDARRKKLHPIGDGRPHPQMVELARLYRDLIEGRASTDYGIEGLFTPVPYHVHV